MNLSHPKFPNSLLEPFLVTSPRTPNYNCIAWAFGDNSKWFWPDPLNQYYWPSNIPREETIEAFIELYRSINYEICENGSLQSGIEKIAIYSNKEGIPTHAARQLPNGYWTSKLGPQYDVAHTINSMENGEYGNVCVFMMRAK